MTTIEWCACAFIIGSICGGVVGIALAVVAINQSGPKFNPPLSGEGKEIRTMSNQTTPSGVDREARHRDAIELVLRRIIDEMSCKSLITREREAQILSPLTDWLARFDPPSSPLAPFHPPEERKEPLASEEKLRWGCRWVRDERCDPNDSGSWMIVSPSGSYVLGEFSKTWLIHHQVLGAHAEADMTKCVAALNACTTPPPDYTAPAPSPLRPAMGQEKNPAPQSSFETAACEAASLLNQGSCPYCAKAFHVLYKAICDRIPASLEGYEKHRGSGKTQR